MIKENIIKDYIDKLSSTSSMPGGGAAAGITLVQGMALILKVCNLTIGKDKYKENEPLVISVKEKMENMIKDVYELIEEDVKSFKEIEKVFKMKKDTDKDKEERKKAMEKACTICLDPPIKMINKAKEGIELAKKIIGKSNESTSSDVIVGIELIKAGAISAYQNVDINRKSIKDTKVLAMCDKIKEDIEEIKKIK